MSVKLWFTVSILMVCKIVLPAVAIDNATNLVGTPTKRQAKDTNQNAENLVSKREINAKIREILYEGNLKTHECVVTNTTSTRNTTKYNSRPLWTVVLLKEENFLDRSLNIQQCSGSLIHPGVVLTAAHCVYKKDIALLKVRAGACNRQINENAVPHQESKIDSISIMKAYDPRKPKQDVALLFLKNPFKITRSIRTVCLPPANVRLDIDYVRCFTTGWIKPTLFQPGHVNFRRFNMTIISGENCVNALQQTALGENFTLHKSLICAAGHFNSALLDTNGGAPLVCPICEHSKQMIQIGVLSWGFKNGPFPEIFTYISKARRWIWEELKKKGLRLSSCGLKWNKHRAQKHATV